MCKVRVWRKELHTSVCHFFFFFKSVRWNSSLCNTERSIAIIKMTGEADFFLFFPFLCYRSDPLYLHGLCRAVCQLNRLSKPAAPRLLEVNNADGEDLVIHSKSQLYF